MSEMSEMERMEGYPKTLNIEITNLCNTNCVICPHDKMTRPRGVMSFELFKKIVDQSVGRIKEINLQWLGEPAVVKNYADYFKYAREKCGDSVRITLFSNAVLLDDPLPLLEAGISGIDFHIEPKQYYADMMPGLDRDLAVRNVLNFLKARNEGEYKTAVEVHYTYAKGKLDNGLEIDTTDINILREYERIFEGCDRIYYACFNLWHDNSTPDLRHDASIYDNKNRKVCHFPWIHMQITWDGKVALCCWDYNNNTKLGDLNIQNVEEVWTGLRMRKVRYKNIAHQFDGLICSTCLINMTSTDWEIVQEGIRGW